VAAYCGGFSSPCALGPFLSENQSDRKCRSLFEVHLGGSRTRLVRRRANAKKIAHRGIWVEPELLAEIENWAKSAEGKVHHPFFKCGLAPDPALPFCRIAYRRLCVYALITP